jgi:Glycosyl hydrolase family 12
LNESRRGARFAGRRLFLAVAAALLPVVAGCAATPVLSHGGRPAAASRPAASTQPTASTQPAASHAGHATAAEICQNDRTPASHGTYVVQNNEFNSSAPECVTTDGSAGFTVANSSIDQAADGTPGGYASIYQGCHWGKCSSGGLASTPIEVSNLTPGKVTTSWSTTQPGGGNVYDAAYDIWFNRTPTTLGQPDCTELMIWLNHDGTVQPFGSQVASVSIGGRGYNVWAGQQPWGDTITYDMTTGTTSVSGLDIGMLAQNAASHGYLPRSCYLIDVEAGFELWRGGAGLATTSFSVSIAGRPALAAGSGAVIAPDRAGRQSCRINAR